MRENKRSTSRRMRGREGERKQKKEWPSNFKGKGSTGRENEKNVEVCKFKEKRINKKDQHGEKP